MYPFQIDNRIELIFYDLAISLFKFCFIQFKSRFIIILFKVIHINLIVTIDFFYILTKLKKILFRIIF